MLARPVPSGVRSKRDSPKRGGASRRSEARRGRARRRRERRAELEGRLAQEAATRMTPSRPSRAPRPRTRTRSSVSGWSWRPQRRSSPSDAAQFEAEVAQATAARTALEQKALGSRRRAPGGTRGDGRQKRAAADQTAASGSGIHRHPSRRFSETRDGLARQLSVVAAALDEARQSKKAEAVAAAEHLGSAKRSFAHAGGRRHSSAARSKTEAPPTWRRRISVTSPHRGRTGRRAERQADLDERLRQEVDTRKLRSSKPWRATRPRTRTWSSVFGRSWRRQRRSSPRVTRSTRLWWRRPPPPAKPRASRSTPPPPLHSKEPGRRGRRKPPPRPHASGSARRNSRRRSRKPPRSQRVLEQKLATPRPRVSRPSKQRAEELTTADAASHRNVRQRTTPW